MKIKRLVLFFCGMLFLHIANAQQNISVCYNGSTAVSLSTAMGTDQYLWQTKPSVGSTWTTVKTWSTDTFVNLNNLTNSLIVRYLLDTNSDAIADDSNIIANITVYPQIVAATIGNTQTICYNSVPANLNIQTAATGGNGIFSNQWQIYNAGNWTDITGQTGNTYQPPTLTVTTQYRLKNVSAFGCGTVYSNSITINVHSPLNVGTITGTQAICYNTAPSLFSFSTNPSGAGNSYTYQWQNSNNGVSFTNILSATNTTYQATNLTDTTYYRLVVWSSICGNADTSNIVSVAVRPQFMTGQIAGNDTICYNTVPNLLTNIQNCSGGDGVYSYQWQNSTDSVTFNNISGATNQNYQPPTLTQTTFYRLCYTSGNNCGTVYSNIIKVKVFPDVAPATIGSNQTICHSSIPTLLSIQTVANGGDGSFSNQWQIYSGSSWTDIIGQTTNTYQPATLTDTTQYRLKSISDFGCGTVYSNSVTINVYAPLNAGIIAGSQTICYSTIPTQFSFSTSPSGANNLYTYQWQNSIDNNNFTNISGATSTTYQAITLTDTSYYRVVVYSTTCGSVDTSNRITVTVRPQLIAGQIAGNDTICYNTAPNLLTNIQNCSGGDAVYSYQWQNSTDSVTFNNISSATNQNYQPPTLTQTTFYRLCYTSGNNCGTVYSNIIKVKVYPQIISPIIDSSQTICHNTIPNAVFIQTTAVGGNGIFANQWQYLNGNIWTNIVGQTGNIYQPSKLTTTTQYRLRSSSDAVCGTVFSNTITINVYPPLEAGIITGTQSICYNTIPTQFLFSTSSSGAGNIYTYQWQNSIDNSNFTNISGATNTTYQAGNLTDTNYYRIIVHSSICGTFDTSNIITVTVFPQFVAGKIADIDTICYNTAPNLLTNIQNCSGGDGNYAYQWQKSTDSILFNDISVATNQNYQPPPLTQTTYYRLQYTSESNCGILYSNNVEIFVHPLPLKKTLIGDTHVCKNQSDVPYHLAETENNIDYFWTILGGTIVNSPNSPQIIVNWNNQAGTGILTLLQTNFLTGCQLTTSYSIEKSLNEAPDKTIIIKKNNSNILICEENSSNIIYQWGFIDLQTNIAEYIPESNARYIQIPHPIDTTKYDYFVITTFLYENNISCSTTTFYKDNTTDISQQNFPKNGLIIYPNPNNGNFWVKIEEEKMTNFTISIVSLLGEQIFTQQYDCYNKAEILFDLNLTAGIYMISIQTEKGITTQKIVIK
ncbi:MAG: T9SS type A sorting domain-containing protein [Bacteroidales bacterium]|jgi:hypothetical protein|nr:T9SS type A sorting domain-containing protein [Bacteroidales bacterium]